jgi:cell division protease FtsH
LKIKKVVQYIQTPLKKQKQTLLAGLLFTMLVLLLFSIFSQFQAPELSSPSTGMTTIEYSAFLAQVRAGNVLAASLGDHHIDALLARPIAEGQNASATQAKLTPEQRKAVITTWSRFVNRSTPIAKGATPLGATTIDPACLVYTRLPGNGDATLIPLLLSKHVVTGTLPSQLAPSWFSLFLKAALFLFITLIMLSILTPWKRFRSPGAIGNRINRIGKSPARRYERAQETNKAHNNRTPPELANAHESPTFSDQTLLKPPSVTFADVAGIDEVRQELEEIVQFLRNPERFERLGARIPRGALLVGPPGTGKTLLAKAVAGEAGVTFFSMSASEFVEIYTGLGAKRVRDLFLQARQSAPCVIFLDELDAVGRKRASGLIGNGEREQTLNQLLVELDGFTARQAIVVMAATNRFDILDKALLRPGRFDRHINISLPDRAGRLAILQVHTRLNPLHEGVSLERLARLTTGMSGAELATLVNEAALCAARRNLEQITDACFEEALERAQLGALRPIVLSETERRIIAYHEGGHALVAYHLPQADRVNRVTILPHGQSLGVTQFLAEEDRYNYSRESLMARLAVGLGGRVAEELTFGPEQVTTGAENDLQIVTSIASNMVTRWGMSEHVGVMFSGNRMEAAAAVLNLQQFNKDALYARSQALVADAAGRLALNGNDLPARQQFFTPTVLSAGKASSITMATLIDLEIQRLLSEGYQMARTILSEHYHQLARLAHALMEHEQLDRAGFEKLLRE